MKLKVVALPVLALLALPILELTSQAAPSADAASCDGMDRSVFHRINPTTSGALLTLSEQEAARASASGGFTVDGGKPFAASAQSRPGLVPVHRLHKNGDFVYVREGGEAKAAVSRYGYTDEGVSFWASPSAQPCAVAVYRYLRGGKHRFAVGDDDRDGLAKDGWKREGPAFYAVAGADNAPAPSPTTPVSPVPSPTEPGSDADDDGKFSIAVYPDTQNETDTRNDGRFLDRSRWVVAHQEALDVRFVAHAGDVVNWGWVTPEQYAVADKAMKPIEQAGIPYALAIGNHDTRAVGHDGVVGSRGYGGAAYANNPECLERLGAAACKSWLLVRHTEEFNATFTAKRYTAVRGAFEEGKVDNIYSTFEAADKKWMVLTLELWPRSEAVAWARKVVADHPDHNVIIQTHSYLEPNGTITQNRGGYGTNSPQYVYDNLVKLYPNITMVFSGHVGSTASRTDTGVNGNKIVSYLECLHSRDNPLRLVTIDTKNGSVTSKVFGVNSGTTYEAENTQTGLSFR